VGAGRGRGRIGNEGGDERDLECALAVVAPEAGAVVDAPVGGELLDGVHRPAARRALLRGAAPRPRHPFAAVAALLLRRACDREAKDRGGRRRERKRKRRRRRVGWMIDEGGSGRRGLLSSGGLPVVEGERRGRITEARTASWCGLRCARSRRLLLSKGV